MFNDINVYSLDVAELKDQDCSSLPLDDSSKLKVQELDPIMGYHKTKLIGIAPCEPIYAVQAFAY